MRAQIAGNKKRQDEQDEKRKTNVLARHVNTPLSDECVLPQINSILTCSVSGTGIGGERRYIFHTGCVQPADDENRKNGI